MGLPMTDPREQSVKNKTIIRLGWIVRLNFDKKKQMVNANKDYCCKIKIILKNVF